MVKMMKKNSLSIEFDEFIPVNTTGECCWCCKWHTHPTTVKYLDEKKEMIDHDYLDLVLCFNTEKCAGFDKYADIERKESSPSHRKVQGS
jgi:hypothetical protein